jgi:hypothetical protein
MSVPKHGCNEREVELEPLKLVSSAFVARSSTLISFLALALLVIRGAPWFPLCCFIALQSLPCSHILPLVRTSPKTSLHAPTRRRQFAQAVIKPRGGRRSRTRHVLIVTLMDIPGVKRMEAHPLSYHVDTTVEVGPTPLLDTWPLAPTEAPSAPLSRHHYNIRPTTCLLPPTGSGICIDSIWGPPRLSVSALT